MEKQSRINKYKQLRDEMKEEVNIEHRPLSKEEVEDDDFLAFLPEDENGHNQMSSLRYGAVDKDNEHIQSAINEAKANLGKEQYNTRLDILSKIKSDDPHYVPTHAKASESGTQRQEKQMSQSSKNEKVNQPKKKMSLLERLAAMSDDADDYDDYDEVEEVEEKASVAHVMKQKKKTNQNPSKPVKKEYKKTQSVKKQMPVEDEENEETSRVVTVLNYVVIAFIIVFVILALFIFKQLLF